MLYQVIAVHLEIFLILCDDGPDAKGLLIFVRREFYNYLYRIPRRSCEGSPETTPYPILNPMSSRATPRWALLRAAVAGSR